MTRSRKKDDAVVMANTGQEGKYGSRGRGGNSRMVEEKSGAAKKNENRAAITAIRKATTLKNSITRTRTRTGKYKAQQTSTLTILRIKRTAIKKST